MGVNLHYVTVTYGVQFWSGDLIIMTTEWWLLVAKRYQDWADYCVILPYYVLDRNVPAIEHVPMSSADRVSVFDNEKTKSSARSNDMEVSEFKRSKENTTTEESENKLVRTVDTTVYWYSVK